MWSSRSRSAPDVSMKPTIKMRKNPKVIFVILNRQAVIKESYNTLYGGIEKTHVKPCTLCSKGKMALMAGSNKSQSLVCNDIDNCMNTVKLGEFIKTCQKQNSKCDKCQSHTLKVKFRLPKQNRSRLTRSTQMRQVSSLLDASAALRSTVIST
jgi:hypothetical protein